MNRYIKLSALSIVGVLVFAGCAGDDVTMEYKIKNENGASKIEAELDKPVLTTRGYWDEVYNSRCSFAYRAFSLAEAAKKEGYGYFSINDRSDSISNTGAMAITSLGALDRYCHQKNFVGKTGLESKKCYESTPIWTVDRATLFKRSSYLYPTWNVEKTISELRPIVKECTDWKDMLPESYTSSNDTNIDIAISKIKRVE